MEAFLTPEAISSGGVVGILALLVIAFVRGWIVPGPAHAEFKAESRAREEKLLSAYNGLQEQNQKLVNATETLVGSTKTTEQVLTMLVRGAGVTAGGGG